MDVQELRKRMDVNERGRMDEGWMEGENGCRNEGRKGWV
jgi:hypothetical protein